MLTVRYPGDGGQFHRCSGDREFLAALKVINPDLPTDARTVFTFQIRQLLTCGQQGEAMSYAS